MLAAWPCKVLRRTQPRSITSLQPEKCFDRQHARHVATSQQGNAFPGQVTIHGKVHKTDSWMNTPSAILDNTSRRLHLQEDHPIAITRKLIESCFPGYAYHNSFSPVVSVAQNFDSLGILPHHPGRSRTDTYYLNRDTLLRTHTSAHQADVYRANQSKGFLISADVYRRDAIDRSHYPIFHQMEGARLWDRAELGGNVAKDVWADLQSIQKHDLIVEDLNPSVHFERNPLQAQHTLEEVEALATHLKRSIERVVVAIFSTARAAAAAAGIDTAASAEPLRIRWVEAYFPFTSPSWELEVYWQGDWLEVLGCGVVLHSLLDNANVPSKIGWAFGIGLDRIAMLLFNIPDVRLFWSLDSRFLSQFTGSGPIRRFAPFSKYPECYKDVSFWVQDSSNSTTGELSPGEAFHENDLMELVRTEAGNLVEDVRMVDDFTDPKSQRKSLCYRINYRSLERTLTNDEVNILHGSIINRLVERLGVEIR